MAPRKSVVKMNAAGRPATSVRGHKKKPTLYNKKRHNDILKLLKKGTSIKDAGLAVGLGKETLDTWLYYGRHQPAEYPLFAKLAEDVDRVRAETRNEVAERIKQTALSGLPGTWQAGAWYLERTDPENWGRKDKVEVENNGSPQIQLNAVVLVDEEVRDAARNLLRRVAGPARPDITIGPGDSVHVEDGDG